MKAKTRSRPNLFKFKQTFEGGKSVTNNMGLGLNLKKSSPNLQFAI